jgi:hypothetical protein
MWRGSDVSSGRRDDCARWGVVMTIRYEEMIVMDVQCARGDVPVRCEEMIVMHVAGI